MNFVTNGNAYSSQSSVNAVNGWSGQFSFCLLCFGKDTFRILTDNAAVLYDQRLLIYAFWSPVLESRNYQTIPSSSEFQGWGQNLVVEKAFRKNRKRCSFLKEVRHFFYLVVCSRYREKHFQFHSSTACFYDYLISVGALRQGKTGNSNHRVA